MHGEMEIDAQTNDELTTEGKEDGRTDNKLSMGRK